MSTARYLVGDVHQQLATLPDGSVDLVLSSPPFLGLRSYLPADHPDKAREIGSESTPGEFLDAILDVVEACARVLTPHGSLVFEFGDTYSGGGGGVDTEIPARKEALWPMDKSLVGVPQAFMLALVHGRNPWTSRATPTWRVRNFCPWVRPSAAPGKMWDKFAPATSYLTVACKARDRWFHEEEDGPAKRDWFAVSSSQYHGDHDATWPPNLLLPFILSMCPPGGTVLDPFAGSGTTLQVATGCGRDAIGIDLDERNLDLARERIGMFLVDEPERPVVDTQGPP